MHRIFPQDISREQDTENSQYGRMLTTRWPKKDSRHNATEMPACGPVWAGNRVHGNTGSTRGYNMFFIPMADVNMNTMQCREVSHLQMCTHVEAYTLSIISTSRSFCVCLST